MFSAPFSLSLSSFWNPYPVNISKHDVYESGTTAWCCSRDLVNCSHLFLFLFSVQLKWFPLLSYWSVPLYHLINDQFLLVYFSPLFLVLYIGLSKKFLQFLSKNNIYIFHFHQEPYWATCSWFCFTVFCCFSGNFIIPSYQSFLSL